MPKSLKALQATQTELLGQIDILKRLCKELKGDDNEMCTKEQRKKAASGQHGIKDNVTRGQLRKGLQERIDQLKRDLAKVNQEILDLA